MDKTHLIQIRPGLFINPNEMTFDKKKLHYLSDMPAIEKARIYVQMGKYGEAKRIYRDLLRRNQDIYLHRSLSSVLSVSELSSMIEEYRAYPAVKRVYQEQRDRLVESTTRRAAFPWVAVLCLALFILCLFAAFIVWFRYLHRLQSSQVNTIEYIHSIPPTYPKQGTRLALSLPDNHVKNIANVVDHAHFAPNTRYILSFRHKPIGYAVYQGGGSYVIALLDTSVSPGYSRSKTTDAKPVATSKKTGELHQYSEHVSAVQLNIVRTAFMYYLSTHGQQPPRSLQSLRSLVPSSIHLNALDYHVAPNPSAISNGHSIPYQPVQVQVDLALHRLVVDIAGQTVLTSGVGIGSASHPTPTGIFTVTQRLVSSDAKVYGPYIFPLNGSHYAIHGTSANGRIGKNDSIGCIEVPNDTAKRLYAVLPVGAVVRIGQHGRTTSPTWFL